MIGVMVVVGMKEMAVMNVLTIPMEMAWMHVLLVVFVEEVYD